MAIDENAFENSFWTLAKELIDEIGPVIGEALQLCDKRLDALETENAQLKNELAKIQNAEIEITGIKSRLDRVEERAAELKYLGVWQSSRTYPAGSAVTHAGSLWITHDMTRAKPGDGATAWQLAQKEWREAR